MASKLNLSSRQMSRLVQLGKAGGQHSGTSPGHHHSTNGTSHLENSNSPLSYFAEIPSDSHPQQQQQSQQSQRVDQIGAGGSRGRSSTGDNANDNHIAGNSSGGSAGSGNVYSSGNVSNGMSEGDPSGRSGGSQHNGGEPALQSPPPAATSHGAFGGIGMQDDGHPQPLVVSQGGAPKQQQLQQQQSQYLEMPIDSDMATDTSTAASSILLNPRFSLRSHLDVVRTVCFAACSPDTGSANGMNSHILASGGDDGVLKLWNLKAVHPSSDLEPIFTLRGHRGPVLATVSVPSSGLLFSAGADASIRVWTVPPSDLDSLSAFRRIVCFQNQLLVGHSDAVWSLDAHGALQGAGREVAALLLSSSADGTVKMWRQSAAAAAAAGSDGSSAFGSGMSCVSSVRLPGGALPTCARFMPSSGTRAIVSATDGSMCCLDLLTGSALWTLSPENRGADACVNCIAMHPTLPLAVAVSEDRGIRLVDTENGCLVSELVGHQDSISSVAFHAVSLGSMFATAGHDESIRFWDLGRRRCYHEVSSHRKKFDEGVLSLVFHPEQSLLASGGADAVVKVYI